MPYAKTFRDLEVYVLSRKLAAEIFVITGSFPKEEIFSLTDQIRRASRSVGAQIAEAWAKRKYERHFVSKLTDADGELQECEHWLDVAKDCGYISDITHKELFALSMELGRKLNSMSIKAESFCKTSKSGNNGNSNSCNR
ncbi:MAG: four helix bundle protein [Elusimicrobia bacterium]|nr:four helix bundle protein [Elusimicrobiota bacterium]